MSPYKSIETVFRRDKQTNILDFGVNRFPEYDCIKEWVVQEKVDGMNIRIIITQNGVEVKGRTDKADLKQDLVDHCKNLVTENVINTLKDYFDITKDEFTITLYGEGYGAGIQKGSIYRPDKAFICFDILYGETMWLNPLQVDSLCKDTNIETVPIICQLSKVPKTKQELLDIIPSSIVALNHTNQIVQSEGIVARPLEVLFNKFGERVMWKLTFREFKN
jgi:hypothetical protein